MTIRFIRGDCRDVLRTLPEESVHCVVTSPPYFGLRDYGVAGQIGLEPTMDEYVSEMVGVFREVRRVLRSDGTLWLNLGDSYASGTKGNNNNGEGGSTLTSGARPHVRAAYNDGRGREARKVDCGGLPDKNLCGIPWRVAFALQADGWFLRQDIIWHKPNPMPESVTDRCTKSHEYMFLLTKRARYFYDDEAVKEGAEARKQQRLTAPEDHPKAKLYGGGNFVDGGISETRNKRSVWTVATAPFKQAHFATFPPVLIEPCIKAGTSERGCCASCGNPWKRKIEITSAPKNVNGRQPKETRNSRS